MAVNGPGLAAGIQCRLPINDPRWREAAFEHGTDADRKNGPAARSFPTGQARGLKAHADAHDCIMVRIRTDLPHTCGAKMRPNGKLPSNHYSDRRRQTLELEERPVSCPSSLREPDRRRRDEKRPFPLRTKNCQHNPKQPLDRKSPYKFESHSLQQRVRCEPDFRGPSASGAARRDSRSARR